MRAFVVAGLYLAVATGVSAAEGPSFEMREIDSHVGNICYAVATADVDGDKRPDIVAVTENRVVWYQNPDWKLRVVIADQTERDNVCLAAHDVDGDGKVDFALGAGWLNQNLGTLHWLSRAESLDEPWNVHFIGRESWTHRIRWGDILGSGRSQLVVSPLTRTVGAGVRVLAFEIPAQPAAQPWKATALDDSLNAMHGHWLGDLDGDGQTDMLTASLEGVFLFRRGPDGKLVRTQIGEGAAGPKEPQKSGAGEIRVGRLAAGRPFIATVEPMHGNQIVVYTPPAGGSLTAAFWERRVLDDTLRRGHAVGVGDVDRDGADELIVGHSDKGAGDPAGPGIFIYDRPDPAADQWTKHTVDNGGIATEDLVVEDVTGDGWPDIVAGGRATHNVRLYVNKGAGK
ncbi:MAG: FG-GAP repeat domain-containing protein [Planctomycetaceae bacterium]